jgi:hypothetical protein
MSYGSTKEAEFTEELMSLIESEHGDAHARSYEDGGILTDNAGFTVRFGDGRAFQVTVVQSGGKREDDEDDDDDD